mgnify:CR=1 FL=1
MRNIKYRLTLYEEILIDAFSGEALIAYAGNICFKINLTPLCFMYRNFSMQ